MAAKRTELTRVKAFEQVMSLLKRSTVPVANFPPQKVYLEADEVQTLSSEAQTSLKVWLDCMQVKAVLLEKKPVAFLTAATQLS